MPLREDIQPYIDGNGLVAPYLVSPGTKRASDNGPLFTSEYFMIQALIGEPPDKGALLCVLNCIDRDWYLHRAPDDTSDDAPDDHYGILSMMRMLKIKGHVKLRPAFWHPALPDLSSPWFFWLSPLVAAIIFFSNLTGGNESNELLSWCLIQGTKRDPFCYVAGRCWLARKNVPEIFVRYFEHGHPFVKYIVEKKV